MKPTPRHIFQNTEFLDRVIQAALHDRMCSWYSAAFNAIEPEFPTPDVVRDALTDSRNWKRITREAKARICEIHVPELNTTRTATWIPFTHFCLRYLTVAMLEQRIPMAYRAAIEDKRIFTQSPESLFQGTTQANARTLLDWVKHSHSRFEWVMRTTLAPVREQIRLDDIMKAIRKSDYAKWESTPDQSHDMSLVMSNLRVLLRAYLESGEIIDGPLQGLQTERWLENVVMSKIDRIISDFDAGEEEREDEDYDEHMMWSEMRHYRSGDNLIVFAHHYGHLQSLLGELKEFISLRFGVEHLWALFEYRPCGYLDEFLPISRPLAKAISETAIIHNIDTRIPDQVNQLCTRLYITRPEAFDPSYEADARFKIRAERLYN